MVSQPESPEMATKKFRTKSHKHELELKSYTKPYICDGCKEQGFGSRYRCEKCDYDLHEYCMGTTPSTYHDFFPNTTFNFLTTPPKACHKHCKRQCDACRKPINGFVYHCKKDDLDLHPCCRNHSAAAPTQIRHRSSRSSISFLFVGLCFVCVSIVHIRCQTERQYFRHRRPTPSCKPIGSAAQLKPLVLHLHL